MTREAVVVIGYINGEKNKTKNKLFVKTPSPFYETSFLKGERYNIKREKSGRNRKISAV